MPPRPIARTQPVSAHIAVAHGAYLLAAGAWPVLHLRSFEAVTGPKLEGWLAKGVGIGMANVGASLALAGRRGEVRRPLRILGLGMALGFAALDFYYAGIRRRISPAYLFNGVAQLIFASAWIGDEIRCAMRAYRQPEAAFA